jgi:hypothetical protein
MTRGPSLDSVLGVEIRITQHLDASPCTKILCIRQGIAATREVYGLQAK